VLDVALVVTVWEAWLATLAILIRHFYPVIFHPHVYPINPSWITGTMPEEKHEHEHSGYLYAHPLRLRDPPVPKTLVLGPTRSC
jgi:hypothetical protein